MGGDRPVTAGRVQGICQFPVRIVTKRLGEQMKWILIEKFTVISVMGKVFRLAVVTHL